MVAFFHMAFFFAKSLNSHARVSLVAGYNGSNSSPKKTYSPGNCQCAVENAQKRDLK